MTRSGILAVVCMAAVAVGCNRDDAAQTTADGRMTGANAPSVEEMTRFVQQAAIANMAEIELGKLATQRAQHPDVKSYANMMIDEHSTALGQLREAAGSQRIALPSQLDEKHLEVQRRLSELQGAEFDREYMKAMVDSHEDTEDLLDDHAETRAPVGSGTPDTGASTGTAASGLTSWAASTLPKVRTHLAQAKALEERVEEQPAANTRSGRR